MFLAQDVLDESNCLRTFDRCDHSRDVGGYTGRYSEPVASVLRKVFLPVDFPASVTPHYNGFSTHMVANIVCSAISRVLATQAMLLAVGIGSKSALPLAAVTSWILKDGIGHLGAIGFGTLINTRFDSDPKRFRFYATCAGKIADMVSILTLAHPTYFLALSAMGGACSRISTTTANSCRAKIYETFAYEDNLGDVLRCATAQSTAAQLLGTSVGVCLSPLVGDNVARLMAANAALAVFSLNFSYRACLYVQMRTLNHQRAELLFHGVIKQMILLEASAGDEPQSLPVPQLPDPEEVRLKELFVMPYESVFSETPLSVNPPLGGSFFMFVPSDSFVCEHYTMGVEVLVKGSKTQASWGVALWLHEAAPATEVIRGFFHACVLRQLMAGAAGREASQAHLVHTHRCSEALVARWWPQVSSAATDSGWRSDVAFLDDKERRIAVSGGPK